MPRTSLDMSRVRKEAKVIAICCGDLHLSHKAPVARIDENWYDAMAYQLQQLYDLKKKYDCPILCAGDIFDRWDSPPELISFALEYLPKMYAIPGNHDLPYHRYDQIKKSAYWTLVEAGKIQNLNPKIHTVITNSKLIVQAVPCGYSIEPNPRKKHIPSYLIDVAIIHSYIWTNRGKNDYPGAPDKQRHTIYMDKLKGYDIAIFGDNHKGFIVANNKIVICNCGGFMRRKSDEMDYKPSVGLIFDDGLVGKYHLDCSKDKLVQLDGRRKENEENDNFVEVCNNIQEMKIQGLDYREYVTRWLERHPQVQEVNNFLMQALDR
jgi:DNA repair exonuclease SbcCD nuclease subunit